MFVAKLPIARFQPAVADRLLELLGTDDEYRALIQHNPRAALARVGMSSPTRQSTSTESRSHPRR